MLGALLRRAGRGARRRDKQRTHLNQFLRQTDRPYRHV
jgi:hypothetical protein